jgi:hypothetical protein
MRAPLTAVPAYLGPVLVPTMVSASSYVPNANL